MSDHQQLPTGESERAAHRLPARTFSLSLPVIMIMVGVSSLALVLATLVGYQMRGGATGEYGPSLAETAATAPQSGSSQQDGAGATDTPDTVEEALDRVGETSSSQEAAAAETRTESAGATIEGPSARGMLHVKPTNVVIPRIGVISDLVDLGLNPDNSLEVPEDYSKAGWFTQGSYPGDLGGSPALIVGHVDNQEGPAVFYDLDQLKIGDEVLVGRADGTTAVFEIYDGQQFPKDTLPTEEIYGDRDGSELVLITCTGEFNPQTGHYLDNYVVRAKLDPERSGLPA